MGSKIKLAWLVAFVLCLGINITEFVIKPSVFNLVWLVIVILITIANFADWNQSRKEVK